MRARSLFPLLIIFASALTVVHAQTVSLESPDVEQLTLLVNDLKQGQSKGSVALWIGPGTLAHFANLRISQ